MPDTIEELELEDNFDLELDNLPHSIKKITFNKESDYKRELNCLPDGLSILELPVHYDKQIRHVPKSLKKLVCSSNYPYHPDFSGIEIDKYYGWI